MRLLTIVRRRPACVLTLLSLAQSLGSAAELGGVLVPPPPGTTATQKATPPLPGTKTPAAMFRELLGMDARQRAEVLADRTEHQRAYLEGRLREYEAMSPQQREARLQQLELSCHLPALMKLAPGNRSERLKSVPAYLLPVVDERLRQWDRLPPDLQQKASEHETTANYFLRVRPTESAVMPAPQPPITASKVASEGDPDRISEQFRQFFALPRKEQQKTLGTLPPAERQEMERTLLEFANLTDEQREICIQSFEKFKRMTRHQRDQFLKNAERWKAMTPRERETWRALIRILPPSPGAPPAPPVTGTVEVGTSQR